MYQASFQAKKQKPEELKAASGVRATLTGSAKNAGGGGLGSALAPAAAQSGPNAGRAPAQPQPVTSPTATGGPTIDERARRIASSGSPLMKRAETKGLQAANRRGLGNSSMAIEAAQMAVLDAAAPMASQEASEAQQYDLAVREDNLRRDMTEAELAQRERSDLASSVAQIQSNQMQALSQTLNNHEIPAETRRALQESIRAQSQQTLSYLQNLYGVSIGGGGGTTNAATVPSTGGGGGFSGPYSGPTTGYAAYRNF